MTNSIPSTPSSGGADQSSQASARQRSAIMAAARDCIVQDGHEKLRMDVVARKAECSRATIYRYFDSKQDILLAIALENHQQINEAVGELTLDVHDIRMKIAVVLAHTMLKNLTADATYRFTPEIIHEEIVSEGSEFKVAVALHIAPAFQVCQKLGWVREGISEDDAVNWLILCTAGLMKLGWPRISGKDLGPDEQVEYLCRYSLYPIFRMEDVLPA